MIFAPQDVALIAVVGFILFGPKKLPEMAKSLGSSIVEFKKAMKSGHEAEGTATPADPNAQPATAATQAVPAAPANPAVAAAPSQQQQLALPAQGHDSRQG